MKRKISIRNVDEISSAKNNEFLLDSIDEGQYVLEGKMVHIPQAGGLSVIIVNNAFGPQTVIQRTDTDITYNLEVCSSQPIGIINAGEIELSCHKRKRAPMEHEETLNRTTGIMNNNP